jgi:hypothetical protein
MSGGASSLTPASRARVLAAWRLYASGNRDLGEDVAHVHVDSARAQEEIERDLTIGAAHCHQSDNLELASRETAVLELARRVPVAAPVDAFAELHELCASTTGQRARVEHAPTRSPSQHPRLRLLELSSGKEPSSACAAGRAPPPDREASSSSTAHRAEPIDGHALEAAPADEERLGNDVRLRHPPVRAFDLVGPVALDRLGAVSDENRELGLVIGRDQRGRYAPPRFRLAIATRCHRRASVTRRRQPSSAEVSGRHRLTAAKMATAAETVARTVATASGIVESGSTHAVYADLTSAFLNRVRWFDSGRGHRRRKALAWLA